ncbi:MAG: FHA domain-containing protein [Candidatus Planktophila sp.]
MAAAENERELTSTLNLGLRSIQTPGEISPAEVFLQRTEASVRAIIAEVCAPGSDKAMLVIHRGPAQGSRFLLDSETTSIGRSPESDVFFDDVTVSRKHAQIQRSNKEFVVVDSQSLNGTYVNSLSVTEQVLRMGDELQIGKFHLLFFGNSHIKSLGEK